MMSHDLFVAPEKRGNGHGLDAANAADYLWIPSTNGEEGKRNPFWTITVRDRLRSGDTTVHFLPGEYTRGGIEIGENGFDLREGGTSTTLLTLKAQTRHRSVFRLVGGQRSVSIRIKHQRNLTISSFTWECPSSSRTVAAYAIGVNYSDHVTIHDCSFNDLTHIKFSAVGGSYSTNITIDSCRFSRIGYDHDSKCIYFEGVRHTTVSDCHFFDCAGPTFVRFKGKDDGFGDPNDLTVIDCNFVSTGRFGLGVRNTRLQDARYRTFIGINKVRNDSPRVFIARNRFTFLPIPGAEPYPEDHLPNLHFGDGLKCLSLSYEGSSDGFNLRGIRGLLKDSTVSTKDKQELLKSAGIDTGSIVVFDNEVNPGIDAELPSVYLACYKVIRVLAGELGEKCEAPYEGRHSVLMTDSWTRADPCGDDKHDQEPKCTDEMYQFDLNSVANKRRFDDIWPLIQPVLFSE